MIAATLRNMRYSDIRAEVRSHFMDLLAKFKNGMEESGQVDGLRIEALHNGQALAGGDAAAWADVVHPNGVEGLLEAFCEARGLNGDLTQEERGMLLTELHKGFRA